MSNRHKLISSLILKLLNLDINLMHTKMKVTMKIII